MLKQSSSPTTLKSQYHYIALSINPPTLSVTNDLSLRKYIQNALTQSFGSSFSNTYLDILSLQYPEQPLASYDFNSVRDRFDDNNAKAVIRVSSEHALRFKAALAAAAVPSTPGSMHVSVIDDTSFLPALLATYTQ